MTDRAAPSKRQRAELTARFGDRASAEIRIDISSTGLLAIGTLVAMTLISTAILVGVARSTRQTIA